MMVHLCYHEIAEGKTGYLYSLPKTTFDDHVGIAGEKGVQITFDDGHRSQWENALPVLERHRRKAIFFITAGWTATDARMMDWTQLRELVHLGHTIGAHGWSHKFLTACSETELRKELERARLHLEDGLGTAVDTMSLPNGRWNRSVLDACRKYGYRRVYGSYPWFTEAGHSPERIGRVNIPAGTDGPALRKLLASDPAKQLLPRLKWKAISTARAVLGEEGYHRLWCFLARHDANERRV